MKRHVRVSGREVEVGDDPTLDVVEVEPGVFSFLKAGKSYEVRVAAGAADLTVEIGGRSFPVEVFDPRDQRRGPAAGVAEGRYHVKAAMPGKVVRALVSQGDTVQAGDGIVVVEAMKMQNEIKSPKNGRIVQLLVGAGGTVAAGETLAVVE